MNDEGGHLDGCVSEHQRWTNLSVVLDRPYIDWMDYKEIKTKKLKKGYNFKEAAIQAFNERQVGLAHFSILQYYILHGHEAVGKKMGEPLVIILHAFRQADGDGILLYLYRLLEIGWPSLKKMAAMELSDLKTELYRFHLPQYNITLILSRGKADKNPALSAYTHFKKSKVFAKADLILSFSVHVGLNPQWGPGTLVVPNKWFPIDVETMTVDRFRAYAGGNHLCSVLDDIVHLSQSQPKVIQRLKKYYHSQNPSKADQTVVALKRSHFKMARIFLELGGFIFTPTNAPKKYFQINFKA